MTDPRPNSILDASGGLSLLLGALVLPLAPPLDFTGPYWPILVVLTVLPLLVVLVDRSTLRLSIGVHLGRIGFLSTFVVYTLLYAASGAGIEPDVPVVVGIWTSGVVFSLLLSRFVGWWWSYSVRTVRQNGRRQ